MTDKTEPNWLCFFSFIIRVICTSLFEAVQKNIGGTNNNERKVTNVTVGNALLPLVCVQVALHALT